MWHVIQASAACRDPVTVISAIFLVLALSAALIDEHKTLQYIGAFGLTITIGSIPVRYNSLQVGKINLFSDAIDSLLCSCRLAGFPIAKPSLQVGDCS